MGFRETLHMYITPKMNLQPWSFRPEAIYELLDKFLERLGAMRAIFEIGTEFSKLDKVEIGGVNGKQINRAILNV